MKPKDRKAKQFKQNLVESKRSTDRSVSRFRKASKPSYNETTLLFKKVIFFLNDNNLLNINIKNIGKLNPKFIYEFIYFDNDPNYQNLLNFCLKFCERYDYLVTGFKKNIKKEDPNKIYYMGSKIPLNRAINLTIDYFNRNSYSNSNHTLHMILLDFCRKILYVSGKINGFTSEVLELRFLKEIEENNIIIAKDNDAIDKILEKFKQTKKEVKIDTITPLIGKVEFLEMVIENKVLFYSTKEPEISKELCKSLIELSTKKGFRKAGNTKAYLNILIPSNKFAKKIGPKLEELEKKGFKTLQSKADELNDKEIKTLREKKWTPMAVKNTYKRWQKLKAEEEEEKNKKGSNPNSPKPK